MFSARLGFMRPDRVSDEGGGNLPEGTGNYAVFSRFTNSSLSPTAYLDTRKPIFEGNPPAPTGENSVFLNRAHNYWHIISLRYANQSNGGVISNITGYNNLTTSQNYINQPNLNMFGIGAYVDQTKTITSSQRGSPMTLADVCVIPHTTNQVTQTEINKLEGYFAHRYNLINLLNPDHPYKSSAPGGFTPEDVTGMIWWSAQDTSRITIQNGVVESWRDRSDTHTLTYRGDYKNNSSASGIFDKFVVQPGDLNGYDTLDAECTLYRPEFTTDDRDTVGDTIGNNSYSVVVVSKTRNHTTSANQAALIWARAHDTNANNYWQIKNIANTSTYLLTEDSGESGNTDVAPANVTTDGGNVSV